MRWLLLILAFPLSLSAQHKLWISFSNKGSQTLSNTEVSISERAKERRIRQNIALSTRDLPINPIYIHQVKALGFEVINRSRWFNGIMVSANDLVNVDSLQSLPFVLDVIDFEVQSFSRNEKANKFELIDTISYGNAFTQLEMLEGHVMHQLGFQGAGIQIAVLDAGFKNTDQLAAFKSLYDNNQILGTWDFVDQEGSVYEDHNHGTAVLSTIGANLTGEMVGTAPQAKFWLLRTEDATSENLIEEYNWLCGVEYADSIGADIINSSLGYTTFDLSHQNHSFADLDGRTTTISKAAVMAARTGMIVCSSAGNYGNSNWYYIGAPADADSILTVGAVYSDETPTSFSSFGPTYDGRVKPTVTAQGGNTTVYSSSDYVTISNGTSFSSPIIAGMVACLWQAFPEKTNMELINAIMQSAHLNNSPENQMGYGIPNFTLASALLASQDSTIPYLSVYPNPIQPYSQVHAYIADQQQISYSIYSMDGKKIVHDKVAINKLPIVTFDIPTLTAGIYILEVLVGDTLLKERLVLSQ